MKYKILSVLLCLCFFAAGHGWAAPAFEPKDCPKDLKYILGMYYGLFCGRAWLGSACF